MCTSGTVTFNSWHRMIAFCQLLSVTCYNVIWMNTNGMNYQWIEPRANSRNPKPYKEFSYQLQLLFLLLSQGKSSTFPHWAPSSAHPPSVWASLSPSDGTGCVSLLWCEHSAQNLLDNYTSGQLRNIKIITTYYRFESKVLSLERLLTFKISFDSPLHED